ncbi:chromatin assembly factor 1 subunit A-B [Drosophila serrata]|uniref:chromatin assembly factor 1 subunit A-B n=1 Tax=Drosophila serrata TaxID=7274 RepID=UPI000A1D12FA|nr:chromatin assembly factor 1 subunit A-B [Drosophila serrata]
MPAGLVKTPNNGKAKESAQKSAERTTSNGKKFVQTRLPFKMITPSGAPTAAVSSTSGLEPGAVVNLDEDDPPVTREPRKRKLSYDDETPPQEGTGCSTEQGLESKENLNLSGAIATKKVKTTAEAVEDQVIELNDDNNEEMGSKAVEEVAAAQPKKPKAAKDTTVKNAKPLKSASKEKPEVKPKEKGSPAPIQIKWPLANKRAKRRKSLKKADESTEDASPKDVEKVGSESSDDIEIIAEELNPQKKPKVLEPEKDKKSKSLEPEKKQMSRKNDQEAVEQKDKVILVEVDKSEEDKKKDKNLSPKETKKSESTSSQESTKKEKKVDKEALAEADISVILSSSEDQNSSSDHEMDVDTEVAEKPDAPLRKSLPESTIDAPKTLTPKQQRLLEQRRKAREEKEQKLAEERRLKQQEKEQREQQKKNEREQKEQQRKLEREEKEQQKKVEREEKERKRQAEVDSKNEEKRKRNEAKEEVQRKKDEERRKKELEREEAEQKKKRAAESFTKFFVPKQPKSGGNTNATSYLEHEQSSCDSTKGNSQTLAFRPFQIKDDMLLAPVTRASMKHEHRSQLDGLFRHAEENEGEDSDTDEDISRRKRPGRAHLYLSELKSGRHKPLKMLRDARLQKYTKEEDDDDVQVIDDLATAGLPIEEEQPKLQARMRTKYLHFADNRRPPYYGTWRKKSQTISARRPLAHDKVHFDYELDSDCEWEEEEPGESLSASEDEKEERESEEESEEEYNEWYVPHGHLSDEELQNDGDGDDGHTREAQKAKLQVLQQEFAQEMKKQTKKIKPRLLGPVWLDENGNQSEQLPAIFVNTISMYACWSAVDSISLEPPPEPERDDQGPEPQLPLQLDDRLLQQLVRLTHGNRNSKTFLINEYLEYLKTQMAASGEPNRTLLPAKAAIREKIEELATWKPVELSTPEQAAKKTKKPKKRLCWIVTSEMLQKFQLQELTLHNQWDYTLTPKVSEAGGGAGGGGAEAQQHELSPPADASPVAAQTPATISASITPNTTPVGQAKSGTKKRATLLMSVPRDQPIPSAAKNALISQFLRRQTDAKEKEKQKELGQKQKPAPIVNDDVVMLSD